MKENLEQILSFCNVIFQHPAYADPEAGAGHEKVLRVRLLPTAEVKAAKGRKVPRQLERGIREADLEKGVRWALARNDAFWNCYFFPGIIPADCTAASDSDVLACPFLFLDFDIRLPVDVREFIDELGLKPWVVWTTSKRQGVARYQMLFAVDAEDAADIEDWKTVQRELIAATGADTKTRNPSRVLRLPSTLNWKDGEETTRGNVEIYAPDNLYLLEDIQEGLIRFKRNSLSRDLCALRAELRLSSVNTKNFGRGEVANTACIGWQEAMAAVEEFEDKGSEGNEAGEAGEGSWTVRCGARHDHLIYWAAQMIAGGIGYAETLKTLEKLNAKALEKPIEGIEYDDIRDFVSELVVRQEAEEAQHAFEVECLMGSKIDADEMAEMGGDSSVSLDNRASGRQGPETGLREPVSLSTGAEISVDDKTLPAPKPPKKPKTGRALSLSDYAHRLPYQCSDQTREDWTNWLVDLAKKILLCKNKSEGSFAPFARCVWQRLNQCGLCYGRWYAAPVYVQCSDGRGYWTLEPMGKEDSQVFFTHFVWSIQNLILANRQTIVDELKKQQIDKPTRALRFAANRSFCSEAVQAILNFGIDNAKQGSGRHDVVIMQNGWLDLGVLEAGNWSEAWHADRSEEEERAAGLGGKGVRTTMAAGRMPGSVSVNFLADEVSGGLETPLFDQFLEECFPGDEAGKRLIYRIVGYCLVCGNPFRRIFYFEGVTAGGKGLLSEIISNLVGKQGSGSVQFCRLAGDAGLGPLVEKSVILVDEAENAKSEIHNDAMATLKRASGGEWVNVRRLREDAYEVRFRGKFILTANKPFAFTDAGGALERRMVPIHFGHSLERVVREPLSLQIAREEGDRIATKAIREIATAWASEGQLMFNVEGASNLRAGRETLLGSTGGVAALLREIITPASSAWSVPSSLLLDVVDVACKKKRFRFDKHGGQASVQVKLEMERMGYPYKAMLVFNSLRTAGPFGPRGRGYEGCRINKVALCDALEMTPDELSRELCERAGTISAGYVQHILDINPVGIITAIEETDLEIGE